jgi:hypothetical protein
MYNPVTQSLIFWLKKIGAKTFRFAFIYKYLCDDFPVQDGLKQVNALLPLLFSVASEYAFQEGLRKPGLLELNGTHWLLAYVDVNLLGENVNNTKINRKYILN